MKVTMYELLGLVKDGKAPKKFIYDNQLFILDEEDNVYRSHLGNRFGAMYQLDIKINDEIEILERALEVLDEIQKLLQPQKLLKDCEGVVYTNGDNNLHIVNPSYVDGLSYAKMQELSTYVYEMPED